MQYSEITIKDIWPKLCELGVVEVSINKSSVYSDSALDVFHKRADYGELVAEYLKLSEEELLGDFYKGFRVTDLYIHIVDGHHCIAEISGYYEDNVLVE